MNRVDNQPVQAGPGDGIKPLMLTVPEACAALRISRWSLYQLIRRRQLETVKIGRRRCIPVAAVEAFVARLQDQEAA
jgi:excisionase family DNA binding protein